MVDVLKSSLTVIGEVSHRTQKAAQVARRTAQPAVAMAGDVLSASRQNRVALADAVRGEVGAVLDRLGRSADGSTVAELEAELADSRARVVQLEQRLADLTAERRRADAAPATAKRVAKKAAPKKPAARKVAASTSTARATAQVAAASDVPHEDGPTTT